MAGALVAACVPLACLDSHSEDVIDGYRAAACVSPLSQPRRVQPATREWDSTFALRNGSNVTVIGHQAAGGSVSVRYDAPEGVVVANAGDYVYPRDVRLDGAHDLLYVKTAGLGAGLLEETLLFEYDLASRRRVRVVRVDPAVLPAECIPLAPAKPAAE
jgi:hypothetical protein